MDAAVRRLTIARFVSGAGATAAIFVGIWGKATFRLHAGPRQMALAAALWGVAAIAGSLAAGLLVDRFDARRVLIWGEIVAVPSVLALTIPESIGPFILLVPLASFSGGIIITALDSFAPFLAHDAVQLSRVNVAIEVAGSLSMIAGPAAGGLIARTLSIDEVFVFDAATSVVALALLARLPIRRLARSAGGRAIGELRDGLRFAYRSRSVRLCLIAGATVWLSFASFVSLESLFYRDVLHSGPALLGWIMSLFGAALLAGSLLLSRLPATFVSARSAVVLVIVLGIGEVVYIGTDKLPVVILGNTIWGIAMGMLFPVLRTLVQLVTPEPLIGRVMGAAVTHNRGAQLLPLVFVGSMAAAWGVQEVLVGTGILLVALAAAGLREAGIVDRLRVADALGELQPAERDLIEPTTRGLL